MNDKEYQKLLATNWATYINANQEAGINSPTPYQVIAYRDGIGIKKTIINNGKPIPKIKAFILSKEDRERIEEDKRNIERIDAQIERRKNDNS